MNIEKINESLGNKDFRYRAYKNIDGINPPRWKRIKHDLPKVEGYREFDNTEVIGKVFPVLKEEGIELLERESHGYLENLNKTYFNAGIVITDGEGDIRVRHEIKDGEDHLQDLNIIRVQKGKKANIIFEYEGNDLKGFRNSLTRIEVEEGAEVNFVNLQIFGSEVESHNSVEIRAERDAKIRYYNFEIGGGVVSASSKVYLEGENVDSKTYSIYIADEEKKMDLEYSSYHKGRRGNSLIEGRGVVKDRARKVFRGNLYFERGSGRSVGKEEETALLMSKEAKADSIPTLFCKEDDVVGEHAASAGQLNDNKLFYLMSRGLSEKEAKRLVAVSSLKPVIATVEDEELRDKIFNEIEKRI